MSAPRTPSEPPGASRTSTDSMWVLFFSSVQLIRRATCRSERAWPWTWAIKLHPAKASPAIHRDEAYPYTNPPRTQGHAHRQ